MKTKVAIVKTDAYETLFDAILKCIDLLNGKEKIKAAHKILLKPN